MSEKPIQNKDDMTNIIPPSEVRKALQMIHDWIVSPVGGTPLEKRQQLLSSLKNKQDLPSDSEIEKQQIENEEQEIANKVREISNPELNPKLKSKIESGQYTLTIGGKTKTELEGEMQTKKIKVSGYAEVMLNNKDFTTSKTAEKLNLVKLSGADLGFPNSATYKEICDKAKELGLDLCPAEVGPHLRLQDDTQPNGNYYFIAMKPISVGVGYPNIFVMGHDDDGLWLEHSDGGTPLRRYDANFQFVFVARK